jgi:class 3 adenylate cyclase
VFWQDNKYRNFFLELGRYFTVIRYDARGNGLSSRSSSNLTWEAHLKDLEVIVSQEDINDCIIWGSTFGVPIAIDFALKHNNKVNSLILDGVYCDGRKLISRTKLYLLILCLRFFPEMAFLLLAHATNPNFRNTLYRRPDVVLSMISPKVASHLYLKSFRINIEKKLSRIPHRTLILHRSHSKSVSLENGKKAAKMVKNSVFVKLDGTSHNLWEEKSSKAIAAILNFYNIVNFNTNNSSIEKSDSKLRLAAILHADVSGYTEKVEKSEMETHHMMSNHLNTLRNLILSYDGTIHNEAGDAILAEFSSAADGFKCAKSFQNAVYNFNTHSNSSDLLKFRIGLHLGDVFEDRNTIFGLSVNIAQRLESLCVPGDMLMSKTYMEALNRQIIGTENITIEEKYLKNISSRMQTCAVKILDIRKEEGID